MFEYKFEVMLIVIVVVLLIFWMMINYFDKKNDRVERFAASSNDPDEDFNVKPSRPAKVENEEKKDKEEIVVEAPEQGKQKKSDTKNNEMQKNLSLTGPGQNMQLTEKLTNYMSLTVQQLVDLKKNSRENGVLGLVFFDDKNNTLRIESTKPS